MFNPISANDVIRKTREIYRQKVSADAGFIVSEVILSRQVKSLAEALTEEINERLVDVVENSSIR